MQTVKALKPLPGRQEGSVFSVDENSAEVLRERGDVEFVDEAGESDGLFTTAANRRSGAAVTQVAAADYPEQPQAVDEPGNEDTDGEPGEVADSDDGTPDTDLPPAPADPDGVTRGGGVAIGNVTKSSNKADLVAVAVGKVKHDDGTDYTEAELESLSKPDLVAKLGL